MGMLGKRMGLATMVLPIALSTVALALYNDDPGHTEEADPAFDALLSFDIVASGYFSKLSFDRNESDPFSPRYVERRFEILEMYQGPSDADAIELVIHSELFAVPGWDMSVYQARQALHSRTALLRRQLASAREVVDSKAVSSRIQSRHQRWAKLLEQQRATIDSGRAPSLIKSYVVGPPQAGFYEAGPILEGVKYVVFLKKTDGRYHFPTWTRDREVFWGEAAEAMEQRIRAVLESEALMDELDEAKQ